MRIVRVLAPVRARRGFRPDWRLRPPAAVPIRPASRQSVLQSHRRPQGTGPRGHGHGHGGTRRRAAASASVTTALPTRAGAARRARTGATRSKPGFPRRRADGRPVPPATRRHEKSATPARPMWSPAARTLLSISRHYGKHASEIAKANHLPAGNQAAHRPDDHHPGPCQGAGEDRVGRASRFERPPRRRRPRRGRRRRSRRRSSRVRSRPRRRHPLRRRPPKAPPTTNTKVAFHRSHRDRPCRQPGDRDARRRSRDDRHHAELPLAGARARHRRLGARVNGQLNDGINVSVPEGTSIKAAEDGVVAYSGNELKGYGKPGPGAPCQRPSSPPMPTRARSW